MLHAHPDYRTLHFASMPIFFIRSRPASASGTESGRVFVGLAISKEAAQVRMPTHTVLFQNDFSF